MIITLNAISLGILLQVSFFRLTLSNRSEKKLESDFLEQLFVIVHIFFSFIRLLSESNVINDNLSFTSSA